VCVCVCVCVYVYIHPSRHIHAHIHVYTHIGVQHTYMYSRSPHTSDSEFRFRCRISGCRISIQSTFVPGSCLVVHKLTESRFGIRKFGIGIEIRSPMYAVTGCITHIHIIVRRAKTYMVMDFLFFIF